jgi:hypothetical protein
VGWVAKKRYEWLSRGMVGLSRGMFGQEVGWVANWKDGWLLGE